MNSIVKCRLGVRSSLTVKISVCWVTIHSVDGAHILKMKFINFFYRDTKYPFEISLIKLVIQGRPL